MASAIGLRTDFRALRHLGPVISRVHQEQLEAFQIHLPNSSQQVRSDVALSVALSEIRTLFANDPNSEAGREAGDLLHLLARHSPAPGNEFKQWAAQQLPDLSGDGVFSPLGSASYFLAEGMRLRKALAGSRTAMTGFGT